MNILESLRVAFSALLSNRLRSALTMLGIVIGVAAVLALTSFGQGFQSFVTSQFQRLGSNLLTIFQARPTGTDANTAKVNPLTLADAQAIGNSPDITGLVAVAPTYNVSFNVVYSGNSLAMQVTGVTPVWQDVRDWAIGEGRFIDNTDIAN